MKLVHFILSSESKLRVYIICRLKWFFVIPKLRPHFLNRFASSRFHCPKRKISLILWACFSKEFKQKWWIILSFHPSLRLILVWIYLGTHNIWASQYDSIYIVIKMKSIYSLPNFRSYLENHLRLLLIIYVISVNV